MASKRDYDRVVSKSAKKIRTVETVAALFSASKDARRRSLDIATSPEVSRKRAEKSFDETAKAKAKSRKKK